MYFGFLGLWIILNGKITAEIVILGIAIAAVMYAFVCRYMGFSIKKDIVIMKKLPLFIQYLIVLVKEICKSNFAVMKLILSPRLQIEPELITFQTDLKTDIAKAILANSITLTPGTITVSLEKDKYVIHCLDKDFAEGIEESIFVQLLRRLEA